MDEAMQQVNQAHNAGPRLKAILVTASGMIGEDPNGIPNNLTPYIAKFCEENNIKCH